MQPKRQCGDCQLCCKLVPVVDNEEPWNRAPINKKAGEKCIFQKVHKGCTVYNKKEMPFACQVWNCRWITNDDTADMPRPDRCHYVLDAVPDYVTAMENGVARNVQVVQIWMDPNYPDAHKDPHLRRYLARRAKEGIIGMVRLNSKDAFMLIAPEMNSSGKWAVINVGLMMQPQHSFTNMVAALGGQVKIEMSER